MSIWVCGEVLIDILPTGPVVGGGPANTAKALARLGYEVDFIDGSLTIAKAMALASEKSHSRYPVVRGSSDEVIGFIHVRDLINPSLANSQAKIQELTRNIMFLPGTKGVLPALTEMRAQRQPPIVKLHLQRRCLFRSGGLVQRLRTHRPRPQRRRGHCRRELRRGLRLGDAVHRARPAAPRQPRHRTRDAGVFRR